MLCLNLLSNRENPRLFDFASMQFSLNERTEKKNFCRREMKIKAMVKNSPISFESRRNLGEDRHRTKQEKSRASRCSNIYRVSRSRGISMIELPHKDTSPAGMM